MYHCYNYRRYCKRRGRLYTERRLGLKYIRTLWRFSHETPQFLTYLIDVYMYVISPTLIGILIGTVNIN